MTDNSVKYRTWPWVEGLLLALIVLAALTMGGESARVSYHGYLHTTIGEAVLSDGLLPENPYHAGEALNYYTLYPTLGVLIGRLGFGALWGFAIINILAALLMGPALDSLTKRLQFSFAVRRASFWCMLLGFNFLGYYFARGASIPPLGAMPFAMLEPMTNVGEWVSWDARLQSFVTKFLNVSSFACSLPLMLFALSNALEDTKRSRLLAAILLGLCIALNPLVGAFSVLLIVGQALLCNPGELMSQIIAWVKLGAVSAIIAVPFIAPLFLNAGAPAAPDKQLPFVGDGAFFNILGPCLLLVLMSAFVVLRLSAKQQKVILLASTLAVLFSFSSLPFSNEYKFPRLFAIFLAIPAGSMIVHYVKGWAPMLAVGMLAILSMPTMFSTIKAYAYWNVSQSLPLTTSSNGELVSRLVDDNLQPALPQSILEAVQELDSDAVIMMHPRFPKVASMAQGNQWAPALQHTLLVDRPQIHNYAYKPEVLSRLGLVISFWGSNDWPATPDPVNYAPQPALSQLRQIVAGRSLAILSVASSTASHDYLSKLRDSGDVSLVSEQGDVYLWLFSAVPKVGGN